MRALGGCEFVSGCNNGPQGGEWAEDDTEGMHGHMWGLQQVPQGTDHGDHWCWQGDGMFIITYAN